MTSAPSQSTPNNRSSPIAFPLFVGMLATAGVLAGLLVLADRPAWWRGYLAATIISAIAALISALPLMWGMRRGIDQRVVGFFVAAGIRSVISLGGCLFAVLVGSYPAMPTMLLMVCYYFVLLTIETTLVARSTWSASAAATAPPSAMQGHAS